jgi:hypothetical protein
MAFNRLTKKLRTNKNRLRNKAARVSRRRNRIGLN